VFSIDRISDSKVLQNILVETQTRTQNVVIWVTEKKSQNKFMVDCSFPSFKQNIGCLISERKAPNCLKTLGTGQKKKLVLFPAKTKDFPNFQNVQTGCGTHLAPYSNGYRGLFPMG
jgi:hypothetical protein